MNNDKNKRISMHDYRIEGVLSHPYESIQMGNGDIGASVNIFPHEIKITLAKSDIWDARFDGKPEQDVLKHDDLIQMMKEKNRDLHNVWETGSQETADYYVDRIVDMPQPHLEGPSPKRAGAVRLYHPGLSNTRVSTRVFLEEGILETRFFFKRGTLIVSAFVDKCRNCFWLHVESEGETPWFAIIAEKEPDQANPGIPMPVLNLESNFTGLIKQTIPEGFDIKEFNWYLSAAFPKGGEGREAYGIEKHAYRFRHYCSLAAGKTAVFCLGIATDRDGDAETSRERAIKLSSLADDFENVLLSHKNEWKKFWDLSNIALNDTELESVWYRNHFAFGCALSGKSKPLGSGGNVMIQDFEPWHGDIHTNHNFQKWFCTAFALNHAEWIDVYAAFINDNLPLFEYQAKLIFDLEGAYCDLSYLPVMSHKYFNIDNHMGRALAVTGWMAQLLWHHWLFMHDKIWLEERGYPYIKKAAQFYYNYLEKYSNESGEIFPSIRLEEPGWQKDFKGNRNVISDLCMFKKTFDWALSAAEILGIDHEWRLKWEKARSRIPEIKHGIDENGEGWIALDKDWPLEEAARRSDTARYSRWGGGGWIVFPGEYVDGDGNDSLTKALRNMILNTDLMNPFFSRVENKLMYPGVPIVHPISSIVPAIRLGVTEHFSSIRKVLLAHRLTYGQFSSYMLSEGDIPKEVMGHNGYIWYDWRSVENKYIGVLAVTEMLLQSQGGIIRLFPFWPEDGTASFKGFRARGGFIISACLENRKISAKIESTAGEAARIKCRNTPEIICSGEKIPCKLKDGAAYFETQKGSVYECSFDV